MLKVPIIYSNSLCRVELQSNAYMFGGGNGSLGLVIVMHLLLLLCMLCCLYQKYVHRGTSRSSKRVGGGGGGIKVRDGRGGENRSKLCSLEGRVSTLALILEGEMQLIAFWLKSNFQPSALLLKRIFWDLNGVGVVEEGQSLFHMSFVHPI